VGPGSPLTPFTFLCEDCFKNLSSSCQAALSTRWDKETANKRKEILGVCERAPGARLCTTRTTCLARAAMPSMAKPGPCSARDSHNSERVGRPPSPKVVAATQKEHRNRYRVKAWDGNGGRRASSAIRRSDSPAWCPLGGTHPVRKDVREIERHRPTRRGATYSLDRPTTQPTASAIPRRDNQIATLWNDRWLPRLISAGALCRRRSP